MIYTVTVSQNMYWCRLCREEDFFKLPLNTPPELQRSDLSHAVLQLKALGIDNIVRYGGPIFSYVLFYEVV